MDRAAHDDAVSQSAAELPGGAGGSPDPRRWRALTICLVAGFMTLLDVSIVNVALPSIRSDLGASPSDLQWVLSGYALAFGLVLVPAGRLGDARGRRRAFVFGLVLFTAASAACGLATSPALLSTARLVQGIGGGMLQPQSAGIIQALFRGAERGKAFGLLGATIGLSTAVGPLTGGLILDLAGSDQAWRWVFFVNVPVGLLALPLALRVIPADLGSGRRESLDPVGMVLLSTGLLLLLLPLVEGTRSSTGRLWWAGVPVAVALLVGFTAWERRYRARGRAPVVDLALFRERTYALGTSLGVLYFAGFTSIFFVLALFLQSGRGYSALETGLVTTPFALGGALAAGLGGRVVTRIGRPLVVAGLVATVAGLVGADLVVTRTGGHGVGWALLLPLLIAGIGSGLVISPNITLSLAPVPVSGAGSAAGVLQTGQRVGSALGIAAVGAVFFAALGKEQDWSRALRAGLAVSVGFVVAALVLALLDLRRGSAEATARSSAGSG